MIPCNCRGWLYFICGAAMRMLVAELGYPRPEGSGYMPSQD